MARGVLWKGKYYVLPQAASKVDSSELRQTAFGSDNRLAFMAVMSGLLEPKKPYKVSNLAEALEVVDPNAAEVRVALGLIFDPAPGSEMPGASEVYLVPVNPATQGSLALAVSGDTQITLKSHLYGLEANRVKVKVEAGTNAGKKVSVAYLTESEVFDDLYLAPLTIQYTGAGSACALTIDPAAGTLVTTATGASADDLNLAFSAYDTIQKLADVIEATGSYDVTIGIDAPNTTPSSVLDVATAVDILAAPFLLTATIQKIVDTINAKSGYVLATRDTANPAPTIDNLDWTYLGGAVAGATTNQDWQDAFDELKAWDVQIILPFTSDASIHAMGDSHCDYMSGPEGKSERSQFVGGALTTWTSAVTRASSVATLKGLAAALNSDRTVHVGLGCKLYNAQGVPTLYPAYMTACAYAGMAAGSTPVEPLTRKFLRVLALEADLRKAEIDTLLEAGLAVPIPAPVGSGYVISRQVTTWLQSEDLYRIEYSIRRGADFIARQVRQRHEELIGLPGTEALDTTILNITNGVLNAAQLAGYIRSYDPKATQIRVEGTIRYVDYSATPIMPVNWIFSTYHLKPLSLTITL